MRLRRVRRRAGPAVKGRLEGVVGAGLGSREALELEADADADADASPARMRRARATSCSGSESLPCVVVGMTNRRRALFLRAERSVVKLFKDKGSLLGVDSGFVDSGLVGVAVLSHTVGCTSSALSSRVSMERGILGAFSGVSPLSGD